MNVKQKDRNQHIKVFARVRPRNSQETRSHIIVECMNNKEIAVKDKGQVKNFAFDRVFGPESKQVDVYKAVVAPMIQEVLQGYNCTVFAYGQTGTGKTFTMVGDKTKDMTGGWENDPLCGIVPRTLDHLFDELKVRAEEYTVRVSFLELYNEELCDLLATADNDDTKTLRLFEDAMKRGSVIVSGLEERTVYEKNDVYPILEAGSLRRQTAPTLMNASSSRSHTIFTITVHVKVTTPEGEDLFKTGKLNLVDLAGSENIGRSGAVDIRAREAGNINQSLLTLGRVITSLVERTPHVPYRESKLTRILQDSLGGRTKTSIIATVSPAMCNLEETLSTFDYAHRARNITNKPEVNQRTSKQVLLKNYTDEIERLRRDLMTTREKHGVYLQNEDYTSMLTQIDSLNKDLINKIQLLKVREDEFAKQEDIMQSLNMNLFETKNDLARNQEILQVKEEAVRERERALQELNHQAQLLLRTADEATEDSKRLHDRLDRARMMLSQNEQVVDKFKSRFVGNLVAMKGATRAFQGRGAELAEALLNLTSTKARGCRDREEELAQVVDSFLSSLDLVMPDLSTRLLALLDNTKPTLEKQIEEIKTVGDGLGDLKAIVSARMEEWLISRDPAWSSLVAQLAGDLDKQKHLGTGLKSAQNCVTEGASHLLQLPADIASRCMNEETRLNLLEAEKKGLLGQIESISLEREALLEALVKKERAVVTELGRVDEELGSMRLRAQEARQQAALSAAETANKKLQDLSQLLISLSNANTSLVASATTVAPAIDLIRKGEAEVNEEMQALFIEQLNAASTMCEELTEAQQQEVTALGHVLQLGHKANEETALILSSFRDRTQSMAEKEEQRLSEMDRAAMAAHRQLAGEISDFCEQTFANIHDRCTELKVNFKEEFLRDEKTGNTPQRKEFQYPKRLVNTGKFCEGQENIPPFSLSRVDSSTTD